MDIDAQVIDALSEWLGVRRTSGEQNEDSDAGVHASYSAAVT
jgi:hypothetical protein